MHKPEWMLDREERGLPFDLYFAGYGFKDSIDFLADNGMPILRSQLNDKSALKRYFSDICPSNSKLFVDSGAFTAHTKGAELDVDSYIKWMNSEDTKISVFAQVDKIPGTFGQPKTKEELLEAPKLSWENYLYMRGKCVSPDKLLPVFHMGEDYKWLHNMLEFTDNGKHIPYICLSPANDSRVPDKMKFLYKCYDIIEHSSNPDVKTHLLGFTSLDKLEVLPAYSADSTSWMHAGTKGTIYSPYGKIDLSKKNKFSLDLNASTLGAISNYVNSMGFNFDELMKSDVLKCKLNMLYLQDWANNYKFKGDIVKASAKRLF